LVGNLRFSRAGNAQPLRALLQSNKEILWAVAAGLLGLCGGPQHSGGGAHLGGEQGGAAGGPIEGDRIPSPPVNASRTMLMSG